MIARETRKNLQYRKFEGAKTSTSTFLTKLVYYNEIIKALAINTANIVCIAILELLLYSGFYGEVTKTQSLLQWCDPHNCNHNFNLHKSNATKLYDIDFAFGISKQYFHRSYFLCPFFIAIFECMLAG